MPATYYESLKVLETINNILTVPVKNILTYLTGTVIIKTTGTVTKINRYHTNFMEDPIWT